MFDTIFSRGLVSIFGGFLISLVIGTTYLWGIISIYITSYYRIVDSKDLTTEITAMVFPFMIFGQATAMPFGVKLMKKVKAKTICIIMSACIGVSFYLSSYTNSFYTFTLLFGILGGVFIGFLYMIPVAHCYKYFPKKKGMVSGIIVAGSGLGTFIFSMMASRSINPNNLVPDVDGEQYYSAIIANNVPVFLRQLSVICFFSILIGSFLLLDLLPGMDPYADAHKNDGPAEKRNTLVELMNQEFEVRHDQDQNDKNTNPFGHAMELGYVNNNYGGENIYGESSQSGFWNWQTPNAISQDYGTYVPPDKYGKGKGKLAGVSTSGPSAQIHHHAPANVNQCPRVRDALTVKVFWVVFLCMMCGSYSGYLVSGNYKSFGKKYIHNDAFLTLIGAVGSMGNGLSRFAWATLLDKFDFKCLYTTLLVINAFLALTIYYAVQIPQLYMFYVFMTYVCYGGHLGMFPAVSSQVFGVRNGSQIYGILFQGFALSNAIQFVIVKILKPQYGYQPIFWFGAVLSGVSIFLVNSFDLKEDWSEKIRENNERKRLAAR